MRRSILSTESFCPRALIVDDDPDVLEYLRFVLQREFPFLIVDCLEQPEARDGYDVYFVDNDFRGRSHAGALATAIRQQNPDSLLVAFSGTLDAGVLKSLINAGCDGACDKSKPEELAETLRVVDQFLRVLRIHSERRPRTALMSALSSITELLKQWNSRLEREERSYATSPHDN